MDYRDRDKMDSDKSSSSSDDLNRSDSESSFNQGSERSSWDNEPSKKDQGSFESESSESRRINRADIDH